MHDHSLSPATRRWLLDLARSTVRAALDDDGARRPGPCDPAEVPDDAAGPGAAFVTLRRDGRLLGCIGSLEPTRSLADDVAAHAYDAAFRDPRLPAVTLDDWHHMDVEISVLGPLAPLAVGDHAELIAALRPGVDGVLLTSDEGRGTFLPSVWDQVGSAEEFVELLWRKAGLRAGRWPADLAVDHYQVTKLSDHDPEHGTDDTTTAD